MGSGPGTDPALDSGGRTSPGGIIPPSSAGGLIRTLSVSLLAMTAVAIGVLISKQRQTQPEPETSARIGEPPESSPTLDAIRAAGL